MNAKNGRSFYILCGEHTFCYINKEAKPSDLIHSLSNLPDDEKYNITLITQTSNSYQSMSDTLSYSCQLADVCLSANKKNAKEIKALISTLENKKQDIRFFMTANTGSLVEIVPHNEIELVPPKLNGSDVVGEPEETVWRDDPKLVPMEKQT